MAISGTNLITDTYGSMREGWQGSGDITYSFLTRVPSYYATYDANGDGRKDSHVLAGWSFAPDEIVAADASVALNDAQR